MTASTATKPRLRFEVTTKSGRVLVVYEAGPKQARRRVRDMGERPIETTQIALANAVDVEGDVFASEQPSGVRRKDGAK